MCQCPECRSENIHRSRAKSKWEGWRKNVTGKRPYRCGACGWRGWGVDADPKLDHRKVETGPRAVAPEPLNLKGTALAWDDRVSDVDLSQLDNLEPIKDKSR